MRNKPAKLALSPLLLACLVCLAATLMANLLSSCSRAFSQASQKPSARPSPPATPVHQQPSPIATARSSQSIPTKQTVANPLRLLIPSIHVNAPIESVGVLANGDLATPTQDPWNDTGWYKLGPRPGEPGSAVIDGHLDRPGGDPAVFWELQYMHVGNTIMVIDAQGANMQFRVTLIARYAPQEAPLQDIFGNNNGTFLNLITCAGDWIPSQHQTTQRLVVYARRM